MYFAAQTVVQVAWYFLDLGNRRTNVFTSSLSLVKTLKIEVFENFDNLEKYLDTMGQSFMCVKGAKWSIVLNDLQCFETESFR